MKDKALLTILALSALPAMALLAGGCGSGSRIADPSNWATAATVRPELAHWGPSPLPTPGTATPKANPPKSNSDTDVFQEIAVKSCTDSAAKEGVTPPVAQQYCDCAVDELMQNVSADEQAQIGAAAASGNETLPSDVEDKLNDAVLDCLDKLMNQ